MRRLLGVAVVACCVLAGCSSTSDGGTASSSSASSAPTEQTSIVQTPTEPPVVETPTSSAPAVAQTYGTVEDFRDAVIAAGYPCPAWLEDDAVTNAAESGNCSDGDVLAIYASDSSRDAQIAQTRTNNQVLIAAGIAPSVVLFGANWSINVKTEADADLLRAALGGVETK